MNRPTGLIIYATKYGSTGEYALALGEELLIPCRQVERVAESELEAAAYLVCGSPIYGPSVLPAMTRFLEKHRSLLERKETAAFVVCGDTLWLPPAGEGGRRNLEKLTRLLPHPPGIEAVFGGRLRMEELDAEDRPKILSFYRSIGREPLGFDRMNLKDARIFAGRIKKRLW